MLRFDLARDRFAVADREEWVTAAVYHGRGDRELGQAPAPARLVVELANTMSIWTAGSVPGVRSVSVVEVAQWLGARAILSDTERRSAEDEIRAARGESVPTRYLEATGT